MGKRKILSIVLCSLVLLVAVSIAIVATVVANEKLPGDNITWVIDDATRTLTIEGTGEMKAEYTTPKQDGSADLLHGAPWTQSEYRNTFDKVVIGEGITNVDRWAFLNLDFVTEITLPSTIEVIEGQAFAGCTSLAKINLTDSTGEVVLENNTLPNVAVIEEHVFYGCTSLTSIVIPSSVTEIKSSAFEGSGLVSVEIPASVKKISFAAFAECASLATVTLNEGLLTIDGNAFANTGITAFNIPSTVTSIAENAIANTPALVSITVASGNTAYKAESNMLLSADRVTLVAASAVSGAYTIPEGVTKIANGAFLGNTTITGVNLNDVTEIGVSAFMNCTGITALEIPSTVTTVKAMAFQGCTGITSLTINEGVTSLGKHAFDGCDGLTAVVIPASVVTVNDYLFANCDSLATVTISDGITKIKYRAFNACTALTDVTLADSISEIGVGAFENCSAMEKITLPKNLETLGEDAFINCDKLSIAVPEDSVNYYSDGYAIYGENRTLLQFYFASNAATSYSPISTTLTIAPNAFENAVNLETVDFSLATSLKTISSMAFKGCTALTEVNFPATVKKVGDSAFENCSALITVGFAEAVEGDTETCEFGASMFKGCDNLVSVVVPEGVVSLEGGTFENCTKLVTVVLPSTLRSIGANLFYNCTSLKNVRLPDGIFTLQSGTFKNCTSLEEFYIPENIGMFYDDVFTGCVNMKKVSVTLEGWKNYCKSNTGNVTADNVGLPLNWCEELYIDGVLTEDIVIYAESLVPDKHGEVYIPGYILRGFKGMKTLTIEEGAYDDGVKLADGIGVTRAASFAFAECTNLEKVTLPSTLQNIGARNFLDCSSLREINLDSVTYVNIYAFEGCSSLRIVDAPALTEVDSSAFNKCTNLKIVNLPAIQSIGNSSFANCPNIISLTIGSGLTSIQDNSFSKSNVYVELINESSKTIALNNTPWYTEAGHITKTDGLWFANNGDVKYLLGYYGEDAAPEYFYLPKEEYTIFDGAFAYCDDIDKIVIPSAVTLGNNMFTGSSLKEVYAGTATASALVDKVSDTVVVNPYIPLSFNGASLVLGNNFIFNYRVSEERLAGFTNPKVIFTVCGESVTVTDYTVENGSYVFKCRNIAPYMMSDTITAKLVAYNGETEYTGYENHYSVTDYCEGLFAYEGNTEKNATTTLVVDILNYGAAAQTFMISEGNEDINTTLANSILTAEQKAWGSTETAPAKTNSFAITGTITTPTLNWEKATLVLKNSITMRFRFTTDLDVSKLTFKAKYGNNEVVFGEVELVSGTTNQYYLYFRGVSAHLMSEVFEFAAYDENGNQVSHAFTYSVESYAYAVQNGANALADLVVALMNYGKATEAYLAAK